jgi:DNA invertase Pin-like site-specific DNA recombinase
MYIVTEVGNIPIGAKKLVTITKDEKDIVKIGYARVSTEGQHLEPQLEALRRVGCDRIYSEKLTGTHRERPQLQEMLRNLREGDLISVVKIDRIARSISDLFNIADEIKASGAHLNIIDQGIDSSTPTGQLLFGILGSLAQFEVSLIKERAAAGRESARARGVKFGRKSKLTAEDREQIQFLHQEKGYSWTELAKRFECSRQTIYRILKGA